MISRLTCKAISVQLHWLAVSQTTGLSYCEARSACTFVCHAITMHKSYSNLTTVAVMLYQRAIECYVPAQCVCLEYILKKHATACAQRARDGSMRMLLSLCTSLFVHAVSHSGGSLCNIISQCTMATLICCTSLTTRSCALMARTVLWTMRMVHRSDDEGIAVFAWPSSLLGSQEGSLQTSDGNSRPHVISGPHCH